MNASEAKYFTPVEDERLAMLPQIAAYKADIGVKVINEDTIREIFTEFSSHLDRDIKAFKKKVIIDFSGVEYLSSSAFTQLRFANEKCRKFGVELHLVNIKNQVLIDDFETTRIGYADSRDAEQRGGIYLHKVEIDRLIGDYHQRALMDIGDKQCFAPFDEKSLPEGVVAYKLKDRTTKTGQRLSGVQQLDGGNIIEVIDEELQTLIKQISDARGGAAASQETTKQLVIDISAVDFLSVEGVQAFAKAASLFNRGSGKISLVGAQPEVMRKLGEMNLTQFLGATDTSMHDWVENAKSLSAA